MRREWRTWAEIEPYDVIVASDNETAVVLENESERLTLQHQRDGIVSYVAPPRHQVALVQVPDLPDAIINLAAHFGLTPVTDTR